MNKRKVLIGLLITVFIVCCIGLGWIMSIGKETENVSNDENIIITCKNDDNKKADEYICNLKGKAENYEVSAISLVIEENSDYKLLEVIPNSSWEGEGELGDVDLYTDENKKDVFDVLRFKILLLNNNTDKINISIVDNSFFDDNFEEHKLEYVNKVINIAK